MHDVAVGVRAHAAVNHKLEASGKKPAGNLHGATSKAKKAGLIDAAEAKTLHTVAADMNVGKHEFSAAQHDKYVKKEVERCAAMGIKTIVADNDDGELAIFRNA